MDSQSNEEVVVDGMFRPLPAPRRVRDRFETQYPDLSAPRGYGWAAVTVIDAEPRSVIVVIEGCDDGWSIANGAEALRPHLQQVDPERELHVIEYWPEGSTIGPAHYDRVEVDPKGRPQWHRLHPTSPDNPRHLEYEGFYTVMANLLAADPGTNSR